MKTLPTIDKDYRGPLRPLFKADAEVNENRIKAVVSSTGNMDRGGCVICPGAYKSAVMKDFVDNGSILIAHDWDDLPVGMPITASISGDEIISEGEFHSTQNAQDARTVCVERMAAGKSVSVSVGFIPDYDAEDGVCFFFGGKEMLDWLKGKEYDLSQFDTKAIKAWQGFCYAVTKIKEVVEWSICIIGMNRKAKAIAAKSLTLDDFEEEEPAQAAATFAQHLDSVLAAVEGAKTRFAGYAAMKAEDKRPLNPDRVAQLKGVRDELSALLESLVVPEEPEAPALTNASNEFNALAFKTLALRQAALRSA